MEEPVEIPSIVLADQAIFTSLRTPTGEGYRLVAMSPGITAEERAEITRRSPSHGSLCDETPTAMALSSYPLGTQRQCVACSRYAGREHTARGGQRVHTHLVVLEPQDFQRFENNPVCVQAALLQLVGPSPNIKPSPCLEKLWLDVTVRPEEVLQEVAPQGPSASQIEQTCMVASLLMQNGHLVGAGSDLSVHLLHCVLSIMPLSERANLPASVGLKYSPSRQMRITLLDQADGEVQRAVQGQNVRIIDLRNPTLLDQGRCGGWFAFVRQRWADGRFEELCRLTAELDTRLAPEALYRLATISRDIDRVREADQMLLEKLVNQYAGAKPEHPTEARLVRQLISATVSRAAELRDAEDNAGAENGSNQGAGPAIKRA